MFRDQRWGRTPMGIRAELVIAATRWHAQPQPPLPHAVGRPALSESEEHLAVTVAVGGVGDRFTVIRERS